MGKCIPMWYQPPDSAFACAHGWLLCFLSCKNVCWYGIEIIKNINTSGKKHMWFLNRGDYNVRNSSHLAGDNSVRVWPYSFTVNCVIVRSSLLFSICRKKAWLNDGLRVGRFVVCLACASEVLKASFQGKSFLEEFLQRWVWTVFQWCFIYWKVRTWWGEVDSSLPLPWVKADLEAASRQRARSFLDGGVELFDSWCIVSLILRLQKMKANLAFLVPLFYTIGVSAFFFPLKGAFLSLFFWEIQRMQLEPNYSMYNLRTQWTKEKNALWWRDSKYLLFFSVLIIDLILK